MRLFFAKKAITAFLFIMILFLVSFLDLRASFSTVKGYIDDFMYGNGEKQVTLAELIADINSAVGDKVYSKYTYVEGYGFLQELMFKKEINNFEIVKAKDGYLHYTYFTNGPNNVGTLVDRMKRLKHAAARNGSKLMYVMTPDKYIPGVTQFERGIPYNYANETAENFLKALDKNGIDTLDFRAVLKAGGKYTEDAYYKTDHHWKVETAFWAYSQFVERLEKIYGMKFPNKDLYTNLNNFNQITYKDSYIGSMGRKTGRLYSGVEDFTFIFPKFDTDFSFYAQNGPQDIHTSGRFEESIVFTPILKGNGDIYDAQSDKFFTYMDGNPGFVEIINNKEEEGPKVLFIKDSLMVPVASFFALGCSKLYMIDPRYYGGSIEDVVDQYDFDYIFVSFTPQNLTEEFFPFYKK